MEAVYHYRVLHLRRLSHIFPGKEARTSPPPLATFLRRVTVKAPEKRCARQHIAIFDRSKLNFDGLYLMYDDRFVAKFKYQRRSIPSFRSFLARNFSVEEYFARAVGASIGGVHPAFHAAACS
jgi:hypothetical protein